MASRAPIVFISGGVRSGKSSFAENFTIDSARKKNAKLHYIAPGQASDAEMAARIEKHQKDRHESGLCWQTWEQSTEIASIADYFTNQDVVLLDCLTTLLNNEFFKSEGRWKDPAFQQEVKYSIIDGIAAIAGRCQMLVVVSNELFSDSMVDERLILSYKKLLGEIHQLVVSMATEAYLVEAGIPLVMKGVKEP